MFDNSPHHAIVSKPDPTNVLWRYMDLSRFLSLLEERALHFARADQMSDRWEGSYSPVNVALRPSLYGDVWEKHGDMMKGYRGYFRQRMHMSCWHEAEEESAAMWELYQREGRGVAIRTTWDDLTASLGSDRAILGGRIAYVDYKSTFIPEGNSYAAFMHKRQSFSHEKEVRLLMMSGTSGPHPTEAGTSIDTGPEGPVIPIPVDITRLIGAIYIAPDAPAWFGDLVRKVVRRYGHDFDVRQSDLNSDPID